MGTYGINEKEIAEEIASAVENSLGEMEGDFDSKTLKEGLKAGVKEILKLGDTYPHTTDRCECKECCEMVPLYRSKKAEQNCEPDWKCPKCGHDNS